MTTTLANIMTHHTFTHETFTSVVWSTLNDKGQAVFTHSVRIDGQSVKDIDHGNDEPQATRDHFAAVDMYLDTKAAENA